MAHLLPVPPEIGQMIEDMACKRRSNGRTTNNVVLFVDIADDFPPLTIEGEVVEWVRESLTENEEMFRALAPTRGPIAWPWHIVSNVQSKEDHGVNRVVVAIHLDSIQQLEPNGFQWCADELTIVAESPPKVLVSADDVLASLKPAPEFITAVGVSAISDELMMVIWHHVCSNDDDWCMAGAGRGMHMQWVRVTYEWEEYFEDADSFGWKGWEGMWQ